jgi:ssDNA-binding Zn-finger/Zn-ribbon topoisomerase 1
MTDGNLSREPGEIVYHFDVERSSIPLAQFIDTARATQEIIDDFNRSLFDNKLKYALRVKTPEEGSLIAVLMVAVPVGGGSVLGFLGTEIGKAFFKGLTTEEPAAWAEKVGAAIRQKLSKSKALEKSDNFKALFRDVEFITHVSPVMDVSKEVEGEAVALVLTNFLKTTTERLKEIGITPEKFRAAFQGRNRIFKGCIDNPEVKGITFDRDTTFSIKRNDFPQRITQLPDPLPADPVKPSDLSFETVDIAVNSPNWKRDGRNWQAATKKYQDISFSIEDESFWRRVEQSDADLKPTIRDNMRVQWAYPAGTAKPSHVKVFRVLTYNGRQLSTPMTDQEIQALQSTVHFVEPETPDLFDERRGTDDKNDKRGE